MEEIYSRFPPFLPEEYTWFDKLGRGARGGEMPVGALPQAIEFAKREGYL
jgi:hypothetical protein